MEDKTQKQLTLVESITNPGQFDFRSMVTVLTARAEGHLKASMQELQRSIGQRFKEIEKLRDDLENQVQRTAERTFDLDSALSGFKTLAEHFAPKAEVKIITKIGRDRFDVGDRPTHWFAALKICLGHSYNMSAESDWISNPISETPEIKSLLDAVISAEDLQIKEKQKVIEIRRRLGDMQSLERQAHAAFVERKLSETEEGAMLMVEIDQVAQRALKAWDPTIDIQQLMSGGQGT